MNVVQLQVLMSADAGEFWGLEPVLSLRMGKIAWWVQDTYARWFKTCCSCMCQLVHW